MLRDCLRCGFTLPIEDFPLGPWAGRLHVCRDCRTANAVIWRVAAVAADGLVRLRAIDALLTLGYIRAARRIAAGATYWPTIIQLREGVPMPRQRLWWISLDADTIALLRMLLRTPDPARTPVAVCAA